jgi:hypothetical protein
LFFLHLLTTPWHLDGEIIPHKDGNANEGNLDHEWKKKYQQIALPGHSIYVFHRAMHFCYANPGNGGKTTKFMRAGWPMSGSLTVMRLKGGERHR